MVENSSEILYQLFSDVFCANAILKRFLSGYLDLYIQGGLDGLVSPIVKPRIKLLTDQQLVHIKQTSLTETPGTYSKKDSFGL